MHPEKLTVWCGLWHGGIIGPYFFRNEEGRAVTVNGDRYRAMLRDFLYPELEDIDIEHMWFQQYGAICHCATETLDLLKEKFGDWTISRRGFINWPPRSCDLTPLDFFLWGYVKSKVYTNKPDTLQALERYIRRVIAEIPLDMLDWVIKNWVDRMHQCKLSRGGHLNDVLFKK